MSAAASPQGQRPSDSTAVILGVDVGGSHTRAVVATADRLHESRAEGPGVPMRPGGGRRTAAVILEVAQRAALAAKLALPAEAAVIGAAGAGGRDEQEELAHAARATELAHRVRVFADAEVALAAAFGDGPGILLNAGTGTIAATRDSAGHLHRSGGYGWQMGDEGGGYWLGRRALQAAGRAFDGREETSTLLARLLGALRLGTFDDLVRWSVEATPAQVGALAPHLLRAAQEGEAVAKRAVDAAAEELAALVAVLQRHVPDQATLAVAITGTLLARGSPLVPAFTEALARRVPRARLLHDSVDALRGALALAHTLLREP